MATSDDSGMMGVALIGVAVVVVVALLQRAGGGAQAMVPTGGPVMSPAAALQQQTGQATAAFQGESSTTGQSAATDSGGGGGGAASRPGTIVQEGVEVVPNSVAGITNPADVVAPIARSMESGREPYRERSPGDPGQIV